MGTWILPRLIGPMKTKELMFFADDIPADYALELGLCNKVVPGEELILLCDGMGGPSGYWPNQGTYVY